MKPYIPPSKNGHPRRIAIPVEEDRGFETPCWIWQGSLSMGYGKLSNGGTNGPEWAHRVYYQDVHGRIPKAQHVHHLCEVRCCVNPDHLTVLTRRRHGRLNPNAKLSIRQVRQIRRKLAQGATNTQLAKRYGVLPATITQIKAGRSWQDDTTCPKCGHTFDPTAGWFHE